MPAKKGLLKREFVVFSKLHPHRIKVIRLGAMALVAAFRAGDEQRWGEIIAEANKAFSKHERGVFSAFAMMEADRNG